MKRPSLPRPAILGYLSFCAGLWISNSRAATPVANPASNGISYQWGVTLGGSDSAVISGAVGQWSWEDPNVPGGGPGGWGHTSHWIALTLSSPSQLALNLSRNASVANPGGGFYPTSNYFPSFTLWRNHDKDAAPATFLESPGLEGTWHTYSNTGNPEWAEDLVYLDHLRNSGTEETAEQNWDLPAGDYTLVVGGLAAASDGASRQGYAAGLTTTPIPEPTAMFSLLGSAAWIVCRRNRTLRPERTLRRSC